MLRRQRDVLGYICRSNDDALRCTQHYTTEYCNLATSFNIVLARALRRAMVFRSVISSSMYDKFSSLLFSLREQKYREDHSRVHAILGLVPPSPFFTPRRLQHARRGAVYSIHPSPCGTRQRHGHVTSLVCLGGCPPSRHKNCSMTTRPISPPGFPNPGSPASSRHSKPSTP